MQYAWVPVRLPDPEGIVICLEIREPPYMWTIVQIGQVKIDEDLNLTYPWRLIHPGDAGDMNLTSDNPEFTKYIEKVIWDRIDQLANNRENCNGEAVDNSEQNPFDIEKVESN